jgi:fructosamine-3-kinase
MVDKPHWYDSIPSKSMSTLESDISWQLLRRIVREWNGSAAELDEVQHLNGGMINNTLLLKLKDGLKLVVKIAPHRVNKELGREGHQLKLFRELGLPCPRVYACNVASLDNPDSYLLMEFVDGVDMGHAAGECGADGFDDIQRHLAELVLAIHDQRSSTYGRVSAEPLPQFANWVEFYRHVYDPIWNDVEKLEFVPTRIRKQIGKIHSRLDLLLSNDDGPRLVHWDIWATNVLVGCDQQGKWRIRGLLDPNCKYAHAEAELAYMELFHTVTPAFFKAYQSRHKLSAQYHQVRRPVYQMYPLLNHVHLFGHDYLKPLVAAVERVAALL